MALVVLAPVTLLLVGIFPVDLLPRSRTGAAWLAVLAGPVLFVVSYAVIQSAIQESVAGQSSRAALVSFVIAVAGFLLALAWLAFRAIKSRSLGT